MKKKIWNDRKYAEQFLYNGTNVLRFRARLSDPWAYYIGAFTKNHTRFASNGHDRSMTNEEIQVFIAAK